MRNMMYDMATDMIPSTRRILSPELRSVRIVLMTGSPPQTVTSRRYWAESLPRADSAAWISSLISLLPEIPVLLAVTMWIPCESHPGWNRLASTSSVQSKITWWAHSSRNRLSNNGLRSLCDERTTARSPPEVSPPNDIRGSDDDDDDDEFDGFMACRMAPRFNDSLLPSFLSWRMSVSWLAMATAQTCKSISKDDHSLRRCTSNKRSKDSPSALLIPMIPTRTTVWDNRKAAWSARRARVACDVATTTEMFRSEHPCAMARMLIWASPRAEKNRPATPATCFIPSPTAATMLHGTLTSMLEIRFFSSSFWNSSSMASLALVASSSGVAKVMLCSEEACEINTTLMPRLSSLPKSLRATPWTPIKPDPSTLMSAMCSMLEKPHTHESDWVSVTLEVKIRVPRNLALKVFRMKMGICGLLEIAGCIVFGWITFAPK
mmetsp:Transcript_20552/g.57022  ORF Transcript_20552/g.57022 Transcript_20552/m.57022 type:complete len:435 (-) Transcript_20552:1238-2542(-)